jgi:hypothetical protein
MSAGMAAGQTAWQGQWVRLRSLRVERARAAVRQAGRAEAAARAAVEARQRRIDASQAAMAALARDWSGPHSTAWPRWNAALIGWRETLADRLERDQYALIDEERTLEEAMDALQRCQALLVRAMARQEAVGELVQQARREAGRALERRAEREQDERTPQKGIA